MEKIYGFKQKDVIGLAQMINNRGNRSLSEVFNEYAIVNGKANGTVRNLYYALAKKSATDKEFCDKYLGGKALQVSQIVQFDKDQERQLIKKILLAKQSGKSVRSEIMALSNGDAKTALRYQNKYRNALRNKPQVISDIIGEIKGEGTTFTDKNMVDTQKSIISNQQFDRLKHEIDNLVGKIALKIRKENACLKERITILESENLKLKSLLYGGIKPIDTKKYFNLSNNKEFIN